MVINGKEVAVSVIDGMKSHPIALGLIVVNAMFVLMTMYWMYLIGESTIRKDALLTEMAKSCVMVPRPQ
jgi:predicted ATP-grasp superfamily ATP-dependent carboligase